jgi:1,4-dihydroxy-2-naphthoate octaprenyltransferase
VRFGREFGQRFHATLLMGSYIATTIFILMGLLPWTTFLVWLTFPLALSNVRSVLRATDRKVFIVSIKQTAMLHLVFGVVFAVGILVAMI